MTASSSRIRNPEHQERPVSAPLSYVLFPGRHHLVTTFQVEYLRRLSRGGTTDADGDTVDLAPGALVVWAVTSATHTGTRRNPLPAHRREAMIERVVAVEGLPSLVAPVPDVPPSPRFATARPMTRANRPASACGWTCSSTSTTSRKNT